MASWMWALPCCLLYVKRQVARGQNKAPLIPEQDSHLSHGKSKSNSSSLPFKDNGSLLSIVVPEGHFLALFVSFQVEVSTKQKRLLHFVPNPKAQITKAASLAPLTLWTRNPCFGPIAAWFAFAHWLPWISNRLCWSGQWQVSVDYQHSLQDEHGSKDYLERRNNRYAKVLTGLHFCLPEVALQLKIFRRKWGEWIFVFFFLFAQVLWWSHCD